MDASSVASADTVVPAAAARASETAARAGSRRVSSHVATPPRYPPLSVSGTAVSDSDQPESHLRGDGPAEADPLENGQGALELAQRGAGRLTVANLAQPLRVADGGGVGRRVGDPDALERQEEHREPDEPLDGDERVRQVGWRERRETPAVRTARP